MKVIKNGVVFDLDRYEHICELEPTIEKNEVDNAVSVRHALRRDTANGWFYVYSVAEDIYPNVRARVGIHTVSEDDAKAMAESRLTYDAYIEFFPDPEGRAASAERKIAELTDKMKVLEDSKTYWMNTSSERAQKIGALEKSVKALAAEAKKGAE